MQPSPNDEDSFNPLYRMRFARFNFPSSSRSSEAEMKTTYKFGARASASVNSHGNALAGAASLYKSMVAGILLALFFCCNSATAELTVASPFTDNAVLQRDMPVPVWGTADAATTITVKFGDQQKSSIADKDGNWKVQLAQMPASFESRTLEISNNTNRISLSNVLVGEVWICSGQSNMQQGISVAPDIKALVKKAKNLRTFEVKRMVAMTEQSSLEGKWVEGHPNSAVAFSFAYFLEEAGDVPVGIILSCWGSSSLEAWMPRDMVETVPHFKTVMEEFDADTEAQRKINSILTRKRPWSRQNDIYLRRQANILYNAMIHPLIPYACRGLVWYQGERNAQSILGMQKEPWFGRHSGMLKYGDTLKAWIQRYRKAWQTDQMKFMIVMLPGYFKPIKTGPRKGAEHPATHSWAWMRESQLKALELPHTSVVNTIDLGNIKNIHPKDKLPIGKRLALMAARDLGHDVQAEGPMMQRVEVQDEQLVVHFRHADGLKTIDGKPPAAFWLADDAGEWVQAEAQLKNQTVVLTSSKIKKPRYVRYAFAGKPTVNLVNSADLPAYPFRTDDFKP